MYISILANITYTRYISSKILPSSAYRHSQAFFRRCRTAAHLLWRHVRPHFRSPRRYAHRTAEVYGLILVCHWISLARYLFLLQNFVRSSCQNVHRMHSSSLISHCSSSTLSDLSPALSSAGVRMRSFANRKTSNCLLTLNHALLSSETPRSSEQLLLRPQTGSGWTSL